jgi:hypothetical protein
MKKAFAAIVAALAWIGLTLQFIFTITDPPSPDVPVIERIIRFFSFFTIISNLIVALVTTAIAFFRGSRFERIVNRAGVMTATAVYITIVAAVYSSFLRAVVNPQGWHVVSDHFIHDIVPPAFVLYWLVLAPKAGITWIDPVKWLIFPALYIVYSLIHGALDNWYPYWFADVDKLGYPTALKNSALVLVAFLIVGLIYAAIAKLVSRTANSAST